MSDTILRVRLDAARADAAQARHLAGRAHDTVTWTRLWAVVCVFAAWQVGEHSTGWVRAGVDLTLTAAAAVAVALLAARVWERRRG